MKDRDEGFARIAEIVALESLIKISSWYTTSHFDTYTQNLAPFIHKISGDDVSEGELNKEEVGGDNMTKREQGTNKGNELQKH